MLERPKILLLDDEPEILELYCDLLSRLPSQPLVRTVNSGARAITMLEADSYSLLISDLNMPVMDGLQVLAIVRRKFPGLRTVVMTAISNEPFRMRAYALGLDLYMVKPSSSQDTQTFLDCIESLMEQDAQPGFRGVQSKSLVDIIQMECLCQSSSVIKVVSSPNEGRIWFLDGQIIDAVAQDLTGEDALKCIISWRTGNFEILPSEPSRPRVIQKPSQNLLLELVQNLDEAQAEIGNQHGEAPSAMGRLASTMSGITGVDFALLFEFKSAMEVGVIESWAVDNVQPLAEWAGKTCADLDAFGDDLKAGNITQFICFGLEFHTALISRGNRRLCVGLNRAMSAEAVHETVNLIGCRWDF